MIQFAIMEKPHGKIKISVKVMKKQAVVEPLPNSKKKKILIEHIQWTGHCALCCNTEINESSFFQLRKFIIGDVPINKEITMWCANVIMYTAESKE